jgi:hypothetical protein
MLTLILQQGLDTRFLRPALNQPIMPSLQARPQNTGLLLLNHDSDTSHPSGILNWHDHTGAVFHKEWSWVATVHMSF